MLTITGLIQYANTSKKKDARTRAEKVKEYQARWVAKREAEGKCVCGGERVPGMKSCQSCLDGARRRRQKTGLPDAVHTRVRRAIAVAEGKCGCCALRVPSANLKTCDVCLQKARDSQKRGRMARKADR